MKKPDYEQALEVYQETENRLTNMLLKNKKTTDKTDWTNGGIIHFHRSEALRMTGYCSEQLGRNQDALKIYTKAVTLAEKMSREMRASTMLPYVGESMLKICSKEGMKKEYWKVQEKMEALLGEEWSKNSIKVAN